MQKFDFEQPPTLSASLCYWPFALEVYFEATLYQFCKVLIFTSSRGSVILKNTPSLSATLCYLSLPWEVYFWTTVHRICRIMFFATSCGSVVLNNAPSLCACWHQIFYVKLDFDFSDGQQYRDRGMSMSNYPHKIAFRILQRSAVSQSVHVDLEISS